MNSTERQKLSELKKHHEAEMSKYSKKVKDYIDQNGDDHSNILTCNQVASNYHRGAYNALLAFEKEILRDE